MELLVVRCWYGVVEMFPVTWGELENEGKGGWEGWREREREGGWEGGREREIERERRVTCTCTHTY